uniref:TSA: Wollemia nobilis Ref_Wollemi_Transcript_14993_1042 transcribed RNA sequence n=1 Tax=Wollemia nobilis TaxID=56998 RepID=A0A0C9RJ72_9CONI
MLREPLLNDGDPPNAERDTENEYIEKRPQPPLGGEYSKSIVYAGLDAIVTSFSLVSSISGVHLSSVNVLVLGFSNLVADGISMGFGDFLSSTTERDLAASERLVTDWDVRNNLHLQAIELVATYESLGMDHQDAQTVVEIFSKYKNIMVDQKMGTLAGGEGETPWKHGVVTFVSFLVFGCTPLLSFLILIPFTRNPSVKFGGACLLAALALILLGLAKAKIAGHKYLTSGLMALLNGGFAAAAAYSIGWTLRNVVGLQD